MALATELKKNSYFMHDGQPVRVTRKELVAYGTHSHSKLKLFVKGLDEKGEKIVTLHHNDKVESLEVIRKKGQVVSKVNEDVQIMDNVSYETLNATCSGELLSSLIEGDEVTFIDVLGQIQIIERRQSGEE